MEESEERTKVKLYELEHELEEKTRDYEETIKEMHEKSEEQLAQLKIYYE